MTWASCWPTGTAGYKANAARRQRCNPTGEVLLAKRALKVPCRTIRGNDRFRLAVPEHGEQPRLIAPPTAVCTPTPRETRLAGVGNIPARTFCLPPGEQGPPREPAADGLSCWDLNGNSVADAEEDINGDGETDQSDLGILLAHWGAGSP